MNTKDFNYILPEDRIAMYPLPERDQSKLLLYRRGSISHTVFSELPDLLPDNAFLFFNNTRVIPARLMFEKASGAHIEIFLLDPVEPSTVVAQAMVAKRNCSWHCAVGNLKRWKDGVKLQKTVNDVSLTATLVSREKQIVRFDWNAGNTFAELVSQAGITPLPPYILRRADLEDRERYQTIYSRYHGAVAAPTAGLHFSDRVFQRLAQKGIGHDQVTLHVSAGTFQPIKTEDPADHTMHHEQIIVSRSNIDNLLVDGRKIIAVGTTSLRTLESVYWFGVKLLSNPDSDFVITQRDAYAYENPPSQEEALQAVASWMKRNNVEHVGGETALYIRPGYKFRMCSGLITNFHQPGSTLILLVAAFVGDDWRRIYQEALDNNYRFLSYGDSSFLDLG